MAMTLVKATPKQQREFIDHFKITMVTFINAPLYDFDVVKFDDWLQVPDGTSTKEFIKGKYGEEAVQLVVDLFEIGLQY